MVLMHPLMVHSASRNILRGKRVITNPPVSLLEPFRFSRENEDEYSIVELKTIKEIGKENACSWKPTREREAVIPERLKAQAQLMKDELARLEAQKAGATVTQAPVAAA